MWEPSLVSQPKATVLFANHTGQISGAEQSLLVLLRSLVGSPYQALCAAPEDGPLPAALRGAGCTHAGVPFRRLHKTWNPVALAAAALSQAKLARSLAGLARDSGAALIHANSTTAHLACGPAAKKLGLPAIWHVRDMVGLGLLGKRLAATADKVIAISHAVAVHLRGAAPDDKIVVIHNAIDAGAYANRATHGAVRAELGIDAATPLAVMVGQLVPWKNHRTFLDAIALAARSVPSLRGLVVGSDMFGDHADYVAALSASAPANVTFLGQRDDVPSILADADFLVVPSDREPFGRVALEAMALSKPVVASATGGLPEIVSHGITGRLCPTNDAQAFADAITELLSDRDLAQSMGKAGRARVADAFSVDRMREQVLAVYEELLDAHRD